MILGPLINIAHADVYQPPLPQVYHPYLYQGGGRYLPPLQYFPPSPLYTDSSDDNDGLLQNLVMLDIL